MGNASDGMRALSENQYRSATEGGVPQIERIDAPGASGELWSVPVPMPGGHLSYTLSVVHVGADGAVSIIDPGWETEAGIARLDAALATFGRGFGDVRTIVVTHAHPDHVGAADLLRRASGAQLLMHEREQAAIERVRALGPADPALRLGEWGVPEPTFSRLAGELDAAAAGLELPDPADAVLSDGARLPIPGLDWEVLWTPGHTPGHICLVDRGARRIFTGDHVLPTVFPGIGLGIDGAAGVAPPGDPIADQLASLQRLEPFDDFEVLPGHGYRFTGLGGRRAAAAAHIVRRAREVAEITEARPELSVWDLASRLTWTGGWERLSASPLLSSALLQVGYYRDFVRGGGLAVEV